MVQNASTFIEKIVNAILKKNFNSENILHTKPAVVLGWDEKTGRTSVYFADDEKQKAYSLLNKTGEILAVDDNVKVYYTKNPAKGWIGMRVGIYNNVKATGVGRPSEWDETSEYFNYYSNRDKDNNYNPKNVAGTKGQINYYATAMGYNNKSTGQRSFSCGSFNKSLGNDSFVSGSGNTVEEGSGQSVILGGNGNTVSGNDCFATGSGNAIYQSNQSTISGSWNNSSNNSAVHCDGDFNTVNKCRSVSVSGSYHNIDDCERAIFSGYRMTAYNVDYSIMGGQSNNVKNTYNALIAGGYNEIQGNLGETCGLVLLGMHNKMVGVCNYSAVFGLYNSVDSFLNGIVSGQHNNIKNSSSCSVFGEYNTIENAYQATFAAGKYLKNSPVEYSSTAIFGQFNNPLADYIFMIGNGTSEYNRSNAFAVTQDGVVICKSVAQIGADGTTVELHDTHLDFTAVGLEKNFSWSEEKYPNSTDPNLNEKPVFILCLTGGDAPAYKFIDMSVFIYGKDDTNTAETVLSDDNKFSVNVKISSEENNVLIEKKDGLYASIPNLAVSGDSDNIIEEKEDGLFAANRKIKLINHTPTSADLSGEECIIMQYDSANDIAGANTTLHKITGLFYEK